MFNNQDYIQRTFELARKGFPKTFPNPLVGCVIVKGGRIIGEGYHKKFGAPHAEVAALRSCKTNPSGATLYVNLEPCLHFGKTPPCVDEIIKRGIKKVVVPIIDSDRRVRREGIKALKKAGVKVRLGVLAEEARKLNEVYLKFKKTGLPFVAIKIATSLDGKMTHPSGNSKWITSEAARAYGRSLRGEYQAILVGINTVLKDNPHLGVRLRGKKDPIRIILDSELRIPDNAEVLRDKNVILATTTKASRLKKNSLKQRGLNIIEFNAKQIPLKKLFHKLADKGIISILVEGGVKVVDSFFREKLVDKIYNFQAPIIKEIKLKNVTYKIIGQDHLVEGYL